MIGLDYSKMVKLTPETLYKKMESSFETMDEREAYTLIKDNYRMILSDIFNKKDRREVSGFIKYFTNSKFITSMSQVMYSETIDDTSKRRINKMCFDYIVLDSKDKDEYIHSLLMGLSKTVNRDVIPRLCADTGLSENFATTLAMSRYSSEKEITNVKRLNRAILRIPLSKVSEQIIVDIYLSLFDHILPLFTGVMLDVWSPQNLNTEEMEEVYGLITLAILDIMNELPIADIKRGLKLFDEDRKMLYPDSTLRMNLTSCSEVDFPRFIRALDELEAEGIYINTR